MELLAAASNWLQSLHQADNSRTVTYTPAAGGVPFTVNARIGKTTFEIANDDGRVLTYESRDFLIAAADLAAKGVAAPVAGDQITEVVGLQTFKYEINVPGQEEAAPFDDFYRQTRRCHTKLFG